MLNSEISSEVDNLYYCARRTKKDNAPGRVQIGWQAAFDR